MQLIDFNACIDYTVVVLLESTRCLLYVARIFFYLEQLENPSVLQHVYGCVSVNVF